MNLVGNGLKFAPGGRVTLRVRRGGKAGPVVEVEDTGVGIPDAVLEQIRAGRGVDGTNEARGREGVGIGLRISRALCELLDVDLEIESAEGAGTLARLVLPLEVRGNGEDPGGVAAPSPVE